MNLLGIDDTYYKSKYKEPVSDFPSESKDVYKRQAPAFDRMMKDSECTYCGQCVAVCPVGALTRCV